MQLHNSVAYQNFDLQTEKKQDGAFQELKNSKALLIFRLSGMINKER